MFPARIRLPLIAAVAIAALGLSAFSTSASAKRLKGKGGFSAKAPKGWKLKSLKGGVYKVSCGANAAVYVVNLKTTKTAADVGADLTTQLGGSASKVKSKKKSYSATVTNGSALSKLKISKKKKYVIVKRSLVIKGAKVKCGKGKARTATAHAASVLSDLGSVMNSIQGGKLQTLALKNAQTLTNGPLPMTRYEYSYSIQGGSGTKYSSALVPTEWLVPSNAGNIGGSQGDFTAVSQPGAPHQGYAQLGLPYYVYIPGCGPTPPGSAVANYVSDPQTVLRNIWQLSRNAFAGGTANSPISNVAPTQLLSNNWIPAYGPGKSQLWFFRFTVNGAGWNGIAGIYPFYAGSGACYWNYYSSVVAVPDNGAPGTGLSLLQTWASWNISFQSNEANIAQAAGGIGDSTTDFKEKLATGKIINFGGLA